MSRPSARFDDAVVGAGVVGLAHAYHLARRGRKVIVFERRGRHEGDAAHDFGALWPIGQPAGPLRRMALRSREIWLEVLSASGLWHERSGSIHPAYRDDEAALLREFAERASDEGFRCELLGPEEIARRSPLIRAEGLIAGLSSHWEVSVDPRQVVAQFPIWLAKERGVRFKYGRQVVGFEAPRVRTTGGDWMADRLWICSVEALATLFPDETASIGLARSMIRGFQTEALSAWRRLGPILAAGPAFRQTPSFQGCPSLTTLRARLARELCEGIDLLIGQDGPGRLTIGSTCPFGVSTRGEEVDRLMIQHARTLLSSLPAISTRWQDTQTSHPTAPYCVILPSPLAAGVTGLGASGMTLSFGLAEDVVNHVLGGD